MQRSYILNLEVSVLQDNHFFRTMHELKEEDFEILEILAHVLAKQFL